MRRCPTGDALRDLLDGAADPATLDHVEGCPACQAALDALSADPAVVPPPAGRARFAPPADFLDRLTESPPPPPPDRDAPPEVPGLAVRRPIGRGGFGVVYEAEQEPMRRVVAVKVLDPGRPVTAAERGRFRREAEAVARLHHPNVVQVFAAGEADGRPYLVMEHAGGLALADQLVGDPWPAREAAGLVATLADAVGAAHERGIVHRDLKPGNILFAADGTPKVADFGLAKLLDEDAGEPTRSGPVVGTPSYAAPEQLAGGAAPSPAADVYALGAVLYELLTGRPPFRGTAPLDVVLQVLHADPLPPARLEPRTPRELDTVCLKCLHKSPARRYPTAAELAADLRRFLDGRPVLARPTSPRERAAKWCRRHPGTTAAGIAGAVLTAGLGLALVWLWQAAETRAELEAHAREQTERRADAEARAARDAGRRSAESRVDHLLTQCEQGEVARGLAGLTAVLAELPADAADLRHLVELNRVAWKYRLVAPTHALPHPNVVRFVRFSPDGRTVATAARLRVRVWDVATGKLLGEPLSHDGPVHGLVVAGPVGASWAAVGPARVWEVSTGRPIAELQSSAAVTTLALAPNGAFLVVGTADGQVRKFSGPRFEAADWTVNLDPVAAVAVSPSGEWVFAGTADGNCHLLAAATGRTVGPPLAVGGCRGAEFAGRRVAVTASEFQVELLDVTPTGLRSFRYFNPRLPVRALAQAGRAGVMAAGLGDDALTPFGQCVLFDTTVGRRLGALEFDGPVSAVAVTPDGSRLLAGGGHRRAAVWVGLPDRPSRLHLANTGYARAAALSPDGRTAAVGRDDTQWAKDAPERSAQLWALPPDQRTGLRLSHPAAAAVAVDPTGAVAVTADRGGRVLAWALPGGTPIGPGLMLPGGAEMLAVLPGGRRAVAAVGSNLHPLDLEAGTVGAAVPAGQWVRCLRVSPDGRLVAVGGKWAELRDADTLRPVGEPLPHAAQVVEIGFGPTADQLLTVTGQGEVTVWGLGDRSVNWRWAWGRPSPAAAVSPDGRRVALGGHDRTVRLVAVGEGPDGSPPAVLPDILTRVGWTPDGKLVLAVALDGTARLLDAATGRAVGPPLPQRVTAAVPLPDGRGVLAAGVGPAVVGWAVPAAEGP